MNIEHLLPQKPDPEWNLKRADIKDYVNLIGNLTLLSKKLNSKIGNGTIPNKIDELTNSKIPITEEVVSNLIRDKFIWNEEKIFARQKQLGIIAYNEIWDY